MSALSCGISSSYTRLAHSRCSMNACWLTQTLLPERSHIRCTLFLRSCTGSWNTRNGYELIVSDKDWTPAGPECGVCVPCQRHSFLIVRLPTHELIKGARVPQALSGPTLQKVVGLFVLPLRTRVKIFVFFPLSTAKQGLCLKKMLPRSCTCPAWMWRSSRWGLLQSVGLVSAAPFMMQPLLSVCSQKSCVTEDTDRGWRHGWALMMKAVLFP